MRRKLAAARSTADADDGLGCFLWQNVSEALHAFFTAMPAVRLEWNISGAASDECVPFVCTSDHNASIAACESLSHQVAFFQAACTPRSSIIVPQRLNDVSAPTGGMEREWLLQGGPRDFIDP